MPNSSEARSREDQDGVARNRTVFRKLIRNHFPEKTEGKQNSILVVEDDPVVSMTLEMALKRKNYHITGIATTGEDALKHIRENKPDLILMDIMLDGEMDGIQVAAKVAIEAFIPIIYLTSSEEEKIFARARDTKPLAFLLKPFNPVELYAAIEVALFRTRMEKELLRSEERYAETLRGICDAVISFDASGRVNYINPSAQNFLRTTSEKAVGRKATTLLRQIRHDNGDIPGFSDWVNAEITPAFPADLVLDNGIVRIPVDLNVNNSKDQDGGPNGGVIIFRDISRRKEEELKWANLVVAAQEADRRRISETIHESLAQLLSAIRLNFTVLETQSENTDEESGRMFRTLKYLLDDAMEECRDISQSLSPRVLEDFGLPAALSELGMKVQKQHNIEAVFKSEGYKGVEKGREIIIFRIAQELVKNVVRHSGAKHLRINLDQSSTDKYVKLNVSDDGCGFMESLFSEAGANSGFGNIKNRIVLLGGKSYLVTSKNKGTTFGVEVPV